jgi:hypothetical protein
LPLVISNAIFHANLITCGEQGCIYVALEVLCWRRFLSVLLLLLLRVHNWIDEFVRVSILPCAEQTLDAAHNLFNSFILILPKFCIAFFPYTLRYRRKYYNIEFVTWRLCDDVYCSWAMNSLALPGLQIFIFVLFIFVTFIFVL